MERFSSLRFAQLVWLILITSHQLSRKYVLRISQEVKAGSTSSLAIKHLTVEWLVAYPFHLGHRWDAPSRRLLDSHLVNRLFSPNNNHLPVVYVAVSVASGTNRTRGGDLSLRSFFFFEKWLRAKSFIFSLLPPLRDQLEDDVPLGAKFSRELFIVVPFL